MDPVTAIGLVAASAQLVGQGASVLKYLSDVKEAPRQAEKLLNEMTAMIDVVTLLKLRFDSFPERIPESQQTPITDSLDSLKELLQEMEARCDPKQRRGAIQRLKWPFQMKETVQYLEKIQRQKEILNLVLQNEQLYGLCPLSTKTLQAQARED